MKKVLLSICPVAFIMTVMFAPMMNAEEHHVEPNIYEEKKININLQRSKDTLIQRDQLPEEQMGLTFEKRTNSLSDLVAQKLFQSSIIETNTITAKADQLQLFSVTEKDIKIQEKVEEEIFQSSTVIKGLLLTIVITLITSIFLFIIPRLKQDVG